MRKLFNIFLFVLCSVAIAGCNDTESSESKLEIKAVNTNFQATGGKGYIQLCLLYTSGTWFVFHSICRPKFKWYPDV